MVGRPSWATTAPSTNSTIEWMSCCGWTTTSMRSKGMSKSRCASMTSRPLLTRVAELVVITRPHREVGVRERLLRGDVGELVGRATAERAPGRGEDEASYLLGGAGAEALGDGTVLGVDRHDLARPGALLHQRAADDERLLVGEGQRGAGVEGGEGGAEADGSGDAVEHDVARSSGGLGGRLLPQPGVRRRELRDLGLEQLGVGPAGGQADHAEPVGVGADEVERLGADGPGRAEDHDVAGSHPCSLSGWAPWTAEGRTGGRSPTPSSSSTCAATSRRSSASATC